MGLRRGLGLFLFYFSRIKSSSSSSSRAGGFVGNFGIVLQILALNETPGCELAVGELWTSDKLFTGLPVVENGHT